MSASVVSRFEFGSWGASVVQGTQLTNVGFSGHQLHTPSGLVLTLYRAYSTTTAHWLSEDPLRWQEGPNLYNYAASNPIKWRDPLGLKVYRCCRDIEVGPILDRVAKAIGAKHCFIKADKREAGMGPADGSPLPRNPVGVKTSIIDHTGQSSRSDCEEIPDADEDCVDKRLAQGASTGRWMPWNNCNTVADDVLCGCKSKRCSIDPYNTPMKPGGYK
jgi:RHS repeat-associated protein